MIKKLMQHIEDNVPELQGKIEANIVSKETNPPCCRYFTKGGDIGSLGGYVGQIEEVQLDIFSKSYTELKAILYKVKKALYSFDYLPERLTYEDNFDEETQWHREIITFQIKFKEY
ncbi:hypothetical protein [Arcobacter roscoffensis]|uniref:DUF3168 domain-containing protein n=1 Tax=Arcobacter roscoffensis TaxID=2961520 RepID=A0ABY5E0Z6_9BACT|nr:hypothetical protein [Arcobacter roscoffensis]UTJ05391.1 hypothetical protein NJU99_08930 [Arcobacter roscoffensis]